MQDLTGKKFNRLLVKRYAYNKNGIRYWECECECGNIVYVCTSKLNNGHTGSCGCYAKDRASESNKTHGHSKEDFLHYVIKKSILSIFLMCRKKY